MAAHTWLVCLSKGCEGRLLLAPSSWGLVVARQMAEGERTPDGSASEVCRRCGRKHEIRQEQATAA